MKKQHNSCSCMQHSIYDEFDAQGKVYYATNHRGIFIPLEFERTILRHIILNNIDFNALRPAPLLFLQGKKGEGKSFMTETVLKENNIYYKIISSSVLTGKNEGDAVGQLRAYYNCCEKNPRAQKYTVLVIDDFHLSIAVSKATASHTTNADNLLEALMNIADRKEPLKTPIILIGNDFTTTYAPLTRAGRATISTWSPSINDKKEIVRRLIIQHNTSITSRDQISQFVDKYSDQYIGFFEKVIENVCFGEFNTVTDYFSECRGDVSFDDLRTRVQDCFDSNFITIEYLYNAAEKLLAAKPQKLDE